MGRSKFLLVLMALLLSSCLVGPNYVHPKVEIPTEFKEAEGVSGSHGIWEPIKPQDDMDRGEWWAIFNDPLLNDLEDQLNHFNQNIAQAEETFQQSVAIVDEARASYFPTIAAAFDIIRQRQGGGATNFVNSSSGGGSIGTTTTPDQTIARTTTTHIGFLTASWEPDIWGLVRRTVEAQLSLAQSNEALIGVTRLSAQGSLAQYYFEIRTLDKNQCFLNDTVKAYQKILKFTQNQYCAGVVSQADVIQARSQLETAQAAAINNGILRGQYEHAIAVLIGRPPAFVDLDRMPLDTKPPPIPISIPSEWLQRRPDIAQSERLLQEYSALIGVAVAAYFPSLNLTGSVTASGNSFHQLIHTPAIGWSTGMQVAEILFDGGLRSATVRAAKHAYMAQLAAYKQVVLTAFQDVEDNLISLRILHEQSILQDKAAADARLALKLVTNQYKAGTVAYNNVLTSQITSFSAQQTANNVHGLLMSSAVGLIKALGGGWVCPQTEHDS